MYTGLIGLIALVVVALIGWGIAELKMKSSYTHSEEEKEGWEEMAEHQAQNGGEEMNIRQIMKNNSTNGYKTT